MRAPCSRASGQGARLGRRRGNTLHALLGVRTSPLPTSSHQVRRRRGRRSADAVPRRGRRGSSVRRGRRTNIPCRWPSRQPPTFSSGTSRAQDQLLLLQQSLSCGEPLLPAETIGGVFMALPSWVVSHSHARRLQGKWTLGGACYLACPTHFRENRVPNRTVRWQGSTGDGTNGDRCPQPSKSGGQGLRISAGCAIRESDYSMLGALREVSMYRGHPDSGRNQVPAQTSLGQYFRPDA